MRIARRARRRSHDDHEAREKRILAQPSSSRPGPDGRSTGGTPRTVTNTYDPLGRLTASTVTAGVGRGDILAAPAYDSAGNQRSTSTTKAGTPNVVKSSTFAVNPLDETIAETRADDGTNVSWSRTNFDPAGNPTDRCVWNVNPGSELCKPVGQGFTTPPAVQTTTAYDARDQRISLAIPGVSTTTYDPAHDYQVAAVYVPTGSGKEHQTIYGYDSRHRLTSITQQLCTISTGHSCSSTVPTASDAYAYDDNDNRTRVVESKDGGAATTWNYCYDALNVLRARNTTSACTVTSGDETYLFDDPGNRTRTVIAGVTTDFAYNGQGQLCKVGSTSCTSPNVTYDSAGRTLTWNGWTLTYDGEGRLSTACKVAGCATGDKVTMAYDGEGRRIELVTRPNGGSATTTTFRYQGEAIAQDVNPATGLAIREYMTDESGRIVKVCDSTCASPTASYLVTWNGHGDALALWRINADGTLTLANSYSYSTWGAPTTTVASGFSDLGFRYLYVGAEDVQWDNALGLGLLYMRARHYGPAIGRFLQPDPSAAESNLYGYAANSPVTKVDPSGTLALRGRLLPRWYGQLLALRLYTGGRIGYWRYRSLLRARVVATRYRVYFYSGDIFGCEGNRFGIGAGQFFNGVVLDVGLAVLAYYTLGLSNLALGAGFLAGTSGIVLGLDNMRHACFDRRL